MTMSSASKEPRAPVEGRPVTRLISVVAQDPSVTDAKGRIVMSKIRIPCEVLAPGPMGYRIHVVDYDATEERYLGRHELPDSPGEEPAHWTTGRPDIVRDYRFHAQNVYALVMNTLARFEHALGRRVGWSFHRHQLKIAPHGMLDANAFYSPSDEGLVFGYFPGLSGATVFTCLSHDVVVHETTHALLDALRERFLDPSSPDQAAFHEGFSDVIALLSVFAQPELVRELLRRGRSRRGNVSVDTIHAADVTVDALKKSALFGLAEQMGVEMEGVRGGALRKSFDLPLDPGLKDTAEFLEPHRRGELFVAAALHAFVVAWGEAITRWAPKGQRAYSLASVAEMGADIADVLVTLWIRAIDYMPPVHLLFGDALSAALTADVEARPDDSRYELRARTRESFAAYGFMPPPTARPSGLWARAPADLDYSNVRFESMRVDKDEVFRFIWENRERLGVHADAYTEVLSVRPCIRVGEDGFTLRETVAEYYQTSSLTPAELQRRRIKAPAGWVAELKQFRKQAESRRAKAISGGESARAVDEESDDQPTTPLYGGGTLVFDEYGHLKYHVSNNVFGRKEQSARLEYLYRAGLLRAGRTGARLSIARLSALHRLRATDARRFPQQAW